MKDRLSITQTEEFVRTRLFLMQDPEYQVFHSRLIPNIPSDLVIGVRIPQLRTFARKFSSDPMAETYLNGLPHTYYEENNLHALLIEAIGDYERTITALDLFLPYVDNWATCDLMRPKVFKRNRPELIKQINVWLVSDHTYTRRFALEMLMVHYLDDDFRDEYLTLAAAVTGEDYYLRMMVAWFFATALAKQYDAALPYLEDRRLPVWTHNKTIQKAVESYRITKEQKVYLRSLKQSAK